MDKVDYFELTSRDSNRYTFIMERVPTVIIPDQLRKIVYTVCAIKRNQMEAAVVLCIVLKFSAAATGPAFVTAKSGTNTLGLELLIEISRMRQQVVIM